MSVPYWCWLNLVKVYYCLSILLISNIVLRLLVFFHVTNGPVFKNIAVLNVISRVIYIMILINHIGCFIPFD